MFLVGSLVAISIQIYC